MMTEVRFHGRGGQGAVTSAEMAALAAISEGKYAQSFPSFGPERRGAPVISYLRVSDKPIGLRMGIEKPDAVLLLDPTLLGVVDVTSGLKEGGILVINTKRQIDEVASRFDARWRLAVLDATGIARETLGVPIANTTMLGALVVTTNVVELNSLVEPLKHRFRKLAEKNIKAMEIAYRQTIIKE
jgi:pyruvate ferredoxin oxidoreductase gamma subunit